MKQIFALILLLFVSVALKAQERYKEYYDDGKLKTAGYINKKYWRTTRTLGYLQARRNKVRRVRL